MPNGAFHKLVTLYYGPFKVLEEVGTMTYKLELLAKAKLHPTFLISLLKKHHRRWIVCITLSPIFYYEFAPLVLVDILDRRMKIKNDRAIIKVLVQWSQVLVEDAT